MVTRALVLGSGGATGIAWEAGVLCGLQACGRGPDAWDVVIGSSAGAFVGAWFLAGDIESLCRDLTHGDPADADRRLRAASGTRLVDALRLGRRQGLGWLPNAWTTTAGAAAFGRYAAARGPRAAGEAAMSLLALRTAHPVRAGHLAGLGAFALTRHPQDSPRWVAYWSRELGPVRTWPDRLVIAAVHLRSGTRRTFDRTSGVPIHRAVAASTAVTLLVAPVTIRGERYGDGGTGSQTNADLAAGFDEVTVVAPTDRGSLAHEVRALRSHGSRVVVVRPADSGLLGHRVASLDVRRRPDSVRAGLADGARLREVLGSRPPPAAPGRPPAGGGSRPPFRSAAPRA
jgi:NTE family protein